MKEVNSNWIELTKEEVKEYFDWVNEQIELGSKKNPSLN